MPSPTISMLPGWLRRTAPPRHGPSIIFFGSTGALPDAVASQKRAVYGQRRTVRASGDKRYHGGPYAARRVLQSAVEPQGEGERKAQATRLQICLGQGVQCRHRHPPDAERIFRSCPHRCVPTVRSSGDRPWRHEACRNAVRDVPIGHGRAARRSPEPDRIRHDTAREPCRPSRSIGTGWDCGRRGRDSGQSSRYSSLPPAESLGDGVSGSHDQGLRRRHFRTKRRC